MPDITKCKGENKDTICIKRDDCLRYTIKPSQYGQSYMAPDVITKDDDNCFYFIPTIKPKGK